MVASGGRSPGLRRAPALDQLDLMKLSLITKYPAPPGLCKASPPQRNAMQSAPPPRAPSDGRRRDMKQNMILIGFIFLVSLFGFLFVFCCCWPCVALVCSPCAGVLLLPALCCPCVLPLCWFAVVACLVSVLCSPCVLLVPLLC